MKLRQLAMAMGLAAASIAGTSHAQTTIVVDPAVRMDPNAPAVVVSPNSGALVTPDDSLPIGQHYSIDQYGRRIIVDDDYDPAWTERRSVFDSSVDRATGTVTLPGYMGPRDATGQ